MPFVCLLLFSSWPRRIFSRRRVETEHADGGGNVVRNQSADRVSMKPNELSAPPASRAPASMDSRSRGKVSIPDSQTVSVQQSRHVPDFTPATMSSPAQETSLTSTLSSDMTTTHATRLSEQLWNKAYDDLKTESPLLLGGYEKILSSRLYESISDCARVSEANRIEQTNRHARRAQMRRIIEFGVEKVKQKEKCKHTPEQNMQFVHSMRDVISLSLQSAPEAALAWTGCSLTLEVNSRTIP